jgi:hypothetical protein
MIIFIKEAIELSWTINLFLIADSKSIFTSITLALLKRFSLTLRDMHDSDGESSYEIIDEMFTPFILWKPLQNGYDLHEKFCQTNLADLTSPMTQLS